jgi:drug/metabolite transporter (DMT)-like permease
MTTQSYLSMAVFIAVAAFFPIFFIVNRIRGARPAAREPLHWHWLQLAGVAGTFVGLMLIYIEFPLVGAVTVAVSAVAVVVGAVLKGRRVQWREAGLIALFLLLAGWAAWAGYDRLT